MVRLVLIINVIFMVAAVKADDLESKIPPRSIYDVLGEKFSSETLGFDLPSKEITLPHGYKVDTIEVPWAINGKSTQVIALGDFNVVNDFLNQNGLRAVKVNGKAVVRFYFLKYQDSGGGPYEEFILGYLAHKPIDTVPEFGNIEEFLKERAKYGAQIVNFVDHLSLGGPAEHALNFHHAIWAGRVAISYPKYYGRIIYNFDPVEKVMEIDVKQPTAKYSERNTAEAEKARRLSFKFSLSLNAQRNEYKDSVLVDYQAVPTKSGKLCTMGNKIFVEVANLDLTGQKVQLRFDGDSSSLNLLKRLSLQPVKVFYAKTIKGFMFTESGAGNDCRSGGLPYNYQEFYPERVLKYLEIN